MARTSPAASLIESIVEGLTQHLQRCASASLAASGSDAGAVGAPSCAAATTPASRLIKIGDPRERALLALVAQCKLAAARMPLPDVALVVLRCPFAESRHRVKAMDGPAVAVAASAAAAAGEAPQHHRA